MAEPLKNLYNKSFFGKLTQSAEAVIPQFNTKAFLNQIYDAEWENRELKQRMRHITEVLHTYLSSNYKKNVKTLLDLIPELVKNGIKPNNLECIFLPDYIEVHGMEDCKTSIKAIEKMTQFVTCEFAIRPFIIKYGIGVIAQMYEWAHHDNEDVRRLASEGCRPRLPWAMAIPYLKENPITILPILDSLKNDSSEYVRRSVANNLNDIAKDNSEIVINLAKKWKGLSEPTDKLIKHACRTLLKQGNPRIMQLFDFGSVEEISIENFLIQTPKVKIGEHLAFSFQLVNQSKLDTLLRLEYGLYYQKANGSLSKKVFKISEKVYTGQSSSTIERKQSFKVITTRKFHPGLHQISLIINGIELEPHDFELVN